MACLSGNWREEWIGVLGFDGSGKVMHGGKNDAFSGLDGHLNGVVWVPFDSVGNAFGCRLGDPHFVAPVVLHGGAKVEAFVSMWCPRFAFVGEDVRENFDAGGRERGLIVVEGAVDLSVCREVGVDSRWP